MIKAAIIATMAIPVLSAAATPYTADLQQSRSAAVNWQAKFQQIEADLIALGVDLSAPSETAVIPETQDTVAVADKGLFFNSADSSLVYIGNVRLRDARANINAKEQLHIYLQNFPGSKEAPAPTKTEVKEATKKIAAPTTTAPKPAKAAGLQSTPAPHPAAVAPEPSGSALKTEPKAEPALINTYHAVADTINNAIFLYSPAAGEEIMLQQGQNVVKVTPGKNAPARILADPQGNILLEGGVVDLCMTDKDGSTTKLKTEGGHVYYHAATHTLHAPGSTQFSHPEGALTCKESLCIELTPGSGGKTKPGKGFMSQFTGLSFEGINRATAKGSVVMSGIATEGRPAVRAEGDTLTYDGKTGACSIIGSKSRLVYGTYEVYADQGLHLLANGDIELRGNNINGAYERESNTPGQMTKGTFKANANVIFRADTGIFSTEKGIFMADSEMDFSCTGPAQLELAPKEGAKAVEQKPGMPNLAIARYGEVTKARATGNVTAHRYEPGTRKRIGELQAATAETDMVTGETLLTGETGKQLIAVYNGNRIVATPAAQKNATMQILQNGDLKLNGAQIEATMINDEGTTRARCKDFVRLIRAEDRLETGSSTELHAPTAILTTTGPLSATLTARAGSTNHADEEKKPGISGFRFNYDGIKEATTARGCTLRTEKGSMQCTGPVRITMDTAGKKNPNAMVGGMKYATAAGNVALAGKDNTGRLLRATGDLLTIDSATGMKVLSGQRVTVGDANNTHIITGKGAAIRIDAKNNVKMVGEKHKTHATNVRNQLNNQNQKKIKK